MTQVIELSYELEKRLTSSSTYVKKDNDHWVKYWKGRIPSNQKLILKFYHNSSDTLTLNQLAFTKLDAFMWGLLLGSSLTNKHSTMVVPPEALSYIKKFCSMHEIPFQCEKRKLRRKGTHKAYSNRYKVKYVVKLPVVIRQFFKVLGLNVRNASFPTFFSKELRLEMVKGYLHSQKCTLTVKKKSSMYPRFIIKTKHVKHGGHKGRFIEELRQLFENVGIKTTSVTVTRDQATWNYLYVDNFTNVMTLMEIFEFNSLKVRTYLLLMKIRRQDDQFRIMTASLSELSLFILGLCYLHGEASDDARDHNVIEYTVIQENVLSSSNNLRRELYMLEEQGFINYFARGKKEFIRVVSGYKHKIDQEVFQKVPTGKEEILFQCNDCLSRFGYLEAWGESGFCCPTCQSTAISAGD